MKHYNKTIAILGLKALHAVLPSGHAVVVFLGWLVHQHCHRAAPAGV